MYIAKIKIYNEHNARNQLAAYYKAQCMFQSRDAIQQHNDNLAGTDDLMCRNEDIQVARPGCKITAIMHAEHVVKVIRLEKVMSEDTSNE